MPDVFEFIKDFDDPKLPFPEWRERMVEAVREYNVMNGTLHEPSNIVSRFYAIKPFTNEKTNNIPGI